jgi:Bacterial SH3 domain/N-acetylmuramoyl-L-alanine amidase
MWANFDGKAYDREQFRARIGALAWNKGWVPDGITLHNTAAPTLAQWAETGPSHDARIRNLQRYYEQEKGWHSGPHLFISRDWINGFSNILRPGVHSRCYNKTRIGIEMVGDFAKEPFDAGDGSKVRDNSVFAVAVLNLKLGFKAEGIVFHKDCHLDDHDCPGKLVVKSEFIRRVNEKMRELDGMPIITPVPRSDVKPTPIEATPGTVLIDGLNMRSGPTTQSIIVGTKHIGDKVNIIGEAANGPTKWYQVEGGWVAARYISKGPGVVPDGPLDDWQEDIYATCFGGPEERDYPMPSAYGGRVHENALECSLSHRFEGTRPLIEVRDRATKETVICKINDVGPWNTRDAYWEEGRGGTSMENDGRPDAEWQFKNKVRAQNGRVPSNPAGIDLTPGVFRALNRNPKIGNFQVDWRFRKAA